MTGTVGSEASDNTSTPVGDKDPVVDDLSEQTQEEAEASFAAGFDATVKDAETIGDKPVPTALEPEQSPASAGEQGGDGIDWQEEAKKTAKRLRRVEGQVGAQKSEMQALAKQLEGRPSAEAAQAAQSEAAATLKHLKQMEESIGEFTELAPFRDELEGVDERLRSLESEGGSEERVSLTAKQVDDIVTSRLVGHAHPDWEKTTKTDEFKGYMLSGGPSVEAFDEFKQAPNDQANEMVEDWKVDFPGWWQEKGSSLFSVNATDSIDLLDRYEASRKASTQQREDQETQVRRRENRLRSSATPKGVGSDPITGLTDEEAFNAGFSRAVGK